MQVSEKIAQFACFPGYVLVAAFAITIVCVCGCGEPHSPPDDTQDRSLVEGQDSPRSLVKKLHHAFLNEDAKSFGECLLGPKEWLRAWRASFEAEVAAQRLRRAVCGAYGPDAVQEYRNTEISSFSLSLPTARDPNWADKVEITVRGGRASFLSIDSLLVDMVLTDRGWRIDATTGAVPGTDLEFGAKWLTAAAFSFRRTTRDVGKSGASIGDVKRLTGKYFYEAMERVAEEP